MLWLRVYRCKQLSQKELGVHDKAVGRLNSGSECAKIRYHVTDCYKKRFMLEPYEEVLSLEKREGGCSA